MEIELFNFSDDKVLLFLLVFARCSGLFLSLPMFGKATPVRIKVALSFMMAFSLFPIVEPLSVDYKPEVVEIAVALGGELAIGFTFGFAVQLLMASVQLSGQVIGLQMGFGLATVLDPQTSQQVSILAQIEVLLAMLIFLSLDAHHYFIRAVSYSFKVITPGGFNPAGQLARGLIDTVGQIFKLSVRIGAPVMITLLLVNFSLGLVARTVPQINVLVVGFPLNIAIGLLILFLFMPYFFSFMAGLFQGLESQIARMIQSM